MKDASREVRFTFSQLSRIRNLGKQRLTKWIDRRYFAPSLTVVRGSRRSYTIEDAAVLWLTSYLYDCGLDLSRRAVAWQARRFRGLEADECFIVADEDAAVYWDINWNTDDNDDDYDPNDLGYGYVLPKSTAVEIVRDVEGIGKFRVISLPDLANKTWRKADRNALDRFELVVEKQHSFRKPRRPTAKVLAFDRSIGANSNERTELKTEPLLLNPLRTSTDDR